MLEIENLSKSVAGNVFFSKLNLKVNEGETVCLCLRSSHSKHLMELILSGLAKPDEGNITFKEHGQDLQHRDIAFSFPVTSGLSDAIHLNEYAAVCASVYGIDIDEIKFLAKKWGISHFMNQRCGKVPDYAMFLSVLAINFRRKPPMHLMDVDYASGLQCLSEIKSIISERMSATQVILTNNAELFSYLADRTVYVGENAVVHMEPAAERIRIEVSDVVAASKLLNPIEVEGNSVVIASVHASAAVASLERGGVKVISLRRERTR
jgi:ABC-type sugar transport system ATPase subunit